MKIFSTRGEEIHDLQTWKRLTISSKNEKHWKPGRSAQTLATFMLEERGMAYIKNRVSKIIGQEILLDRAVPEFQVRFDRFGQGRVNDLAVWGKTGAGETVFIGVEAKVDESFNASVGSVYKRALKNRAAGQSTRLPDRIETLFSLFDLKEGVETSQLRYQLLYATAGIMAVEADTFVQMILVFETGLYDPKKGARNRRDFDYFIQVFGDHHPIEKCGPNSHKLALNQKTLYATYDTVRIEG